MTLQVSDRNETLLLEIAAGWNNLSHLAGCGAAPDDVRAAAQDLRGRVQCLAIDADLPVEDFTVLTLQDALTGRALDLAGRIAAGDRTSYRPLQTLAFAVHLDMMKRIVP